MGRLDDALGTLEVAVDLLEDSAARFMASRPRRASSKGSPKSPAKTLDGGKKDDLMGSLFSPEQLTDVKHQLDTAIERLESALEAADGAR